MHERHVHLCQRQNGEFEDESRVGCVSGKVRRSRGVSERCFCVLVSETVFAIKLTLP